VFKTRKTTLSFTLNHEIGNIFTEMCKEESLRVSEKIRSLFSNRIKTSYSLSLKIEETLRSITERKVFGDCVDLRKVRMSVCLDNELVRGFKTKCKKANTSCSEALRTLVNMSVCKKIISDKNLLLQEQNLESMRQRDLKKIEEFENMTNEYSHFNRTQEGANQI